MTKSFFYFIFLLVVCCTGSLSAERESSLEIRSAAFFHSSELFKKIYGNRGTSYQLEASNKIHLYGADQWANFDWFSKHGRSDGENDPTRVNIATISIGLKYSYQLFEQLQPYMGLGISLASIEVKNKGECHHTSQSKLSVGGILKTGIYYFVTERVFIDLYADYLYQPIHFEKHIDIGGLKTGVGLGVQF